MPYSPSSNSTDIIGYVFAVMVAAGGTMGYIRRGSIVSMTSGVISGASIAYGAYVNSKDPQNVIFSLVSCGLLAVAMGSRFLKSGKFVPAGLISVLSLAMTVRYGLRLN